MTAAPTNPGVKPRLAFVVNNLAPYRIESHTRVKNEIPRFAVDTYITWDTSRNLWVYKDLPDIGVVTFPEAVAESQIGTLAYYVGDWKTGRRIIQRLERDRPAAVVCCGYGYPAMFRVILWCRRSGTPCLLWSDSNVVGDVHAWPKRFIKNLVVPWIVRRVGAVLVCGLNGERYYAHYGAPPAKMSFFPVEPDYRLIDATPPELVAEIKAKFGFRDDRRRLLVCSRLVDVKAVDQAIDAFAAIAYQRPDLDLVILGNGPLRGILEARVPSTLRPRVIFAGFFDKQEYVNAFYKSCDILFHPAKYEPWGLVILEAAAAGLAIITTTAVGSAAELVVDGVNGRLVRPNDRRALAQAVLDVTQGDRLTAMKAASRQVSRHFRESHDPVVGLSTALVRLGLLPAEESIASPAAPAR